MDMYPYPQLPDTVYRNTWRGFVEACLRTVLPCWKTRLPVLLRCVEFQNQINVIWAPALRDISTEVLTYSVQFRANLQRGVAAVAIFVRACLFTSWWWVRVIFAPNYS